MVRLGAGETGGETIEEDLEDSTSDSDAGSDTSVEDRGQTIVDTGGRDTEPEPDPDPEPDPIPTSDSGSGQARPSGSPTESSDMGQPEPEQPARGGGGSTGTRGGTRPTGGSETSTGGGSRDTTLDSGPSGGGSPKQDLTPTPDQPARGGGSTRTRGSTADEVVKQVDKEAARTSNGGLFDAVSGATAGVNDAFEQKTGDIDFYRTPSDQVKWGPGEPPDDWEQVTFGEALRTEFVTPDTDVLDSLTSSKGGTGFISKEQEQTLRDRAEAIDEGPLNLSDELEQWTESVTGSDKAGAVASGVGRIPSEVVAGVDRAILAGDALTEAGQNTRRTVDEYGAKETLQAAGETVGLAAAATGAEIARNPYESAGEIGGSFLLGAGAFKAVEKAGDVSSSAKTLSKADDTVDVEDLTDAKKVGQTSGSDYPEFSEEAVGDTDVALNEFRRAMGDKPDTVKERTGGPSMFHGTEQGPFPDAGDVTPGDRSEVAGQFFAGDLSELRLSGGGGSSLPSSLADLKPRLPDLGDKREVIATSPKSVDAVPDELGGGRVPGDDLDKPVMDTDIFGRKKTVGRETGDVSDYMLDEGGEGEAFIMPKGTRTSEQEAVIPEGTPFTDTGDTIAVKMGAGDYIPMRTFTYGDGPDIDVDDLDDMPSPNDVDMPVTDLPDTRVDRPGSASTGGGLFGGSGGLGVSTPGGSGPDTTIPTSGGSGVGETPASVPDTPSTPPSPPWSEPSGSGGPTSPPWSEPSGTSGGSPFGGSGPSGTSAGPTSGGSSGGPSGGTGGPSGSGGSPPTGGSPSGPSGGSGGSPPYGDTPPSGGSSKPPFDENMPWMDDDEIMKDIERVQRDFDTGIADVEDLLGGDS